MTGVIAARELKALLTSPLAWVLAALAQFVLAWRFLQLVDTYQLELQPLVVRLDAGYGATELIAAAFLADPWVMLVLLLIVALLAMNLIADERQQGTLPLLLAAPVRSTAIVLGKFGGAAAFLTLILMLWGLMPLSLQAGTDLDLGRFAAGWLGLWLMGLSLLAMATLASGLTARPSLAAGLTVAAGLLLLLLNQGVAADDGLLVRLSLVPHYQSFLGGLVSSADLAYFGLLSLGALIFAVRRLDALRVQA